MPAPALPENDRPEDLARPPTPPYEASAFGGLVVDDPFLRPLLFGAGITLSPNPVLGVELAGWASPDLGTADWRAVTKQIVVDNGVVPDLSRITAAAAVSLKFTPLYGALHPGRRAPLALDQHAPDQSSARARA